MFFDYFDNKFRIVLVYRGAPEELFLEFFKKIVHGFSRLPIFVKKVYQRYFTGSKVEDMQICSKFTGEQLCRSVISIKLLEITLWHGCSPVNFLHIFRTPFYKNIFGGLLLSQATQSTSRSNHRRCSIKMLFLKFLQYSQENTCVGVSFW